jgi:hypothetical protein
MKLSFFLMKYMIRHVLEKGIALLGGIILDYCHCTFAAATKKKE